MSERESSGVVLLLATSVLWGTTGAAQQLADVDAAPPAVGAARLVVGASALLALALLAGRQRALLGAFSGPSRRWTVAAGVATAGYQAAFFSAVDEAGVALATVVALGSAPVFCALLARQWLREPLPSTWLAATACAVAGCALLLLPGSESTLSLTAVVLAVVAGCCYGVYTTCAKRLLGGEGDAIAVLAATLAVGAILSAPVFFAGAAALASPAGAALAGWLGLVATAGAYLLFARGLTRVPAASAGTLSLAEPLTAALLGIAVLGERPGPIVLAGALLLALGLALTALRQNSPSWEGAGSSSTGAAASISSTISGSGTTGSGGSGWGGGSSASSSGSRAKSARSVSSSERV
ncbi:MAG TPA: EamA family transporter [Solirubrobacteraceae bacterium]|nr:EamA family transporter [Solirubrobacteraceae bacterium]